MTGGYSLTDCTTSDSSAGIDLYTLTGGRLDAAAVSASASRRVSVDRAIAPLALPAPLVDERGALAGLILARLHDRGARTGQHFDEQGARALARRLLEPTPLTYSEIEEALGIRERRHTRGVVECLTRVGLLFDAGNSVILPGKPVELSMSIERGGRWPEVELGRVPMISIGDRVRVSASSRLALELRIYRVSHPVPHGVARRSIVLCGLARGRTIDLLFDPLERSREDRVEQVLLYASFARTAVQQDDGASDSRSSSAIPVEAAAESLAQAITRERQGLLDAAGPGWLVEYLFQRRQ